jgi:hypothetical protein
MVLLPGTAGNEGATPVARERAPTGVFADHAGARALPFRARAGKRSPFRNSL